MTSEPQKNPAAVALGRLGRAAKTKAQARAARANGRKGGRPKKSNTMKHWSMIKTNLKMSTLESAYAAACRAHQQTPRMSVDEMHIYLAETFGGCRTKKALEAAIEATF